MELSVNSADDSFEEFARIIPDGTEAEQALDLVCDGRVDDHHSWFIRVERGTRPEDSGSEVSVSERNSSPDPGYWGGYYKLSLQDPVKKPCTVGWLMGRGFLKEFQGPPRGLDLLVIRPGKKTHCVASVHARMAVHPKSGVLLLFGLQEDKPVLYRVHDSSKHVVLRQGQSHVVYQPANTLLIGKLRYTLSLRSSMKCSIPS